MANLWEQLNRLYPEVLSPDPASAINGTKLFEKVVGRLEGEYAENSIRQHFSVMSQDPTSSIAKVTTGHGYYLREQLTSQATIDSAAPTLLSTPVELSKGRDLQLEEKFRFIFMRHAERSNVFPMHVEHTRASSRAAGVNRWKFPDVVLLNWRVGDMTDQGYRLDPNLLQVKMSLGEQPFLLRSVELKVDLSLASFRESFFQCVSNSKWAHGATLAIATSIDDSTLSDELRRLGASYDVSVDSYGLSAEFLESLPPASKIRAMTDSEFDEAIAPQITVQRVSSGKERSALDWEHILDLRSLSPGFRQLFEWVAYCLAQRRPYRFADFDQIQKIERTVG
ncbi:MAG: hypothetical protein JSU00_04380 [Acidobacteria bacterium]|nr:hypothetical protein [Acidobacteriota bacterium]